MRSGDEISVTLDNQSKVIYRCPQLKRKRTMAVGSHNRSVSISRAMRLQSLGSPNWNEPVTFFGTKTHPDLDLLELTGVYPFTDKQWYEYDSADKRKLLLQCECITEEEVEKPVHEFAACYAYQVISLDTLADELRPIIRQCIGLHKNG